MGTVSIVPAVPIVPIVVRYVYGKQTRSLHDMYAAT